MPEPIDPRISLANERTLLSWMRCAAAVLGYTRWQRADTAVRTGVEIPSNHELRTVSHAIAIIAGAGSLIGVLNR